MEKVIGLGNIKSWLFDVVLWFMYTWGKWREFYTKPENLLLCILARNDMKWTKMIFELTGSLNLFSKRLAMARRANSGELVYYIDFLLAHHIWPVDHTGMYIVALGDQEVPIFYLHWENIFSFCSLVKLTSVQFSSVAQSCRTLCDPMNRSIPGLPVHHQLLEFTQTHVHQVGDVIQPSYPLLSPSPPAHNPSQHQGLFQWVNSLHEVAKVLEFHL